jgi:hypothetical protein
LGVIAGVIRAGVEKSESNHPARTRPGAINAASGSTPIQASHVLRVIPDLVMRVFQMIRRTGGP